MIALLQLIDNPYQDIPLAAVLRSPIVGLKENELVLIRLANKETSYYEAFLTFNQKMEPTMEEAVVQEKTIRFAESLEKWRNRLDATRLATCCGRFIGKRPILIMLAGCLLANNAKPIYMRWSIGPRRMKTTFRGLFQFVRFIEKCKKKTKI